MSSESAVTRLTEFGLSNRKLLQQLESATTRLVQAVADTQFWHERCVEAATKDHQAQMAAADTAHQQTITQARTAYEQQTTQATQTHERQVTKRETDYKGVISTAQTAYQAVLEQLPAQVRVIHDNAGLSAAAWDDSRWTTWQPFADGAASPVTRLGQLNEGGAWHKLTMPALLPLIGGHSLLFKLQGAGRDQAARTTQSLLLRLLATLPAGKLRFIFIDPVGLGQNVAPFMHLADYDEQLVTSKAWTEPQHIEQRLADLTEHMENVIQKYLRNQYASIEAYNAQAGEVAEPYRVLVIHDFPTNFSETAARRLVSITQNGPRCGVYVVALVDTDKPLPHGFNLADLEQNATVIAWNGERFVWQDEDFKDCRLELDVPPPAELFDRIVKTVGEAAKEASKVEVPFARIAPALANCWTGSAQDGLNVPLGPSGARKFQSFSLGKGTAQHALVAGRTGSGKSNLLHVLITNLALTYSPEEVALYLIDFKKGVEFKAYATHQLPHARVIAIEGEREFGLSVLQGLDVELARRSVPFKNAQVDSLADYRQKTKQPLARVLLLVDEFQEFFAEDDAIATQAAQILDRLVRQGRSFGIHVMLGSQTLAGSYSLARSTIDQMGVRIALQCSEADSRLILADDNAAARLLARPGEAIYNAANGRVEGNNSFQVALLADEEREKYLEQVQQLVAAQAYKPAQPQIIFEGNAPAAIEKNQLLHERLAAADWSSVGRKVVAWLGEPIAIKEPTAAYFRRQSGSNLLIVGQNDEQALGILASALFSLAVQHAPATVKFYLLDFSPVDVPYADVFQKIATQLPHPLRYGRRRELPELIAEIKAEVDSRMTDEKAAGSASTPAIYLFIYGLHRARDLRQEEGIGFGSYNFGASGEESPPPNPAQQFPTILQEGPELGIHTLVWCDTVTNLNRVLDRRALREFETRVAFQMGAEDSANFIDTPAASKLGPYRALLVSEEEGRIEKFRPYGLPDEAWLAQVVEAVVRRA